MILCIVSFPDDHRVFHSVSRILYTHRSSSAGEREERMQRNFGVLKQSIWLPHWDTGTLFHPA